MRRTLAVMLVSLLPFAFVGFPANVHAQSQFDLENTDDPLNPPSAAESESPPEESAKAEKSIVFPRPSGPKKRIAVAKFDAIGKYQGVVGSWDIGGGLAAMLATTLVKSGHFIVVERADLAAVLREQTMGLKGIVSKPTAARVGQVLGAQILVRGSVTEFSQKSGGGGLRVGFGTGILGGALGLKSTTGHVAIDLRLIDTTTSQVLQSHRAEAQISASGVSVDFSVQKVSFGGDRFDKAPIGKATRRAIEKAVLFIIQTMEKVPWTGRVVQVVNDNVYVNAGRNMNIRAGQRLVVVAETMKLTDPSTGLVLGAEEERLGEIEVVKVKEKYSVARREKFFPVKRGDIVKLLGK